MAAYTDWRFDLSAFAPFGQITVRSTTTCPGLCLGIIEVGRINYKTCQMLGRIHLLFNQRNSSFSTFIRSFIVAGYHKRIVETSLYCFCTTDNILIYDGGEVYKTFMLLRNIASIYDFIYEKWVYFKILIISRILSHATFATI